MCARRCLFNTSTTIWSVILQYAADTCAEDQQDYTIAMSHAISVANLATLLLDLATFQQHNKKKRLVTNLATWVNFI